MGLKREPLHPGLAGPRPRPPRPDAPDPSWEPAPAGNPMMPESARSIPDSEPMSPAPATGFSGPVPVSRNPVSPNRRDGG